MNCPNCKGDNPAGTDFCHHCGWDLPNNPPAQKSTSSLIKCPTCGAGNPPDAVVCSLCGEHFVSKEQTVPQEQSETNFASPGSADNSEDSTPAGSEKELREREELLRKDNDGLTSAAEKAHLGDLELKLKNNRQGAASLFFEACLMAPKNARIRKRYISLFPREDLQDWGFGKAPVPIWSDLKNILLYPFTEGAWLTLLLASIFISIVRIIAPYSGLFVFGLIAILIAFISSHICLHIRWAANGKFGEPPAVDLDFSNLWYMFMSSLAAYLPGVLIALLGGLLATSNQFLIVFVLYFIGAFIGLFINPMCFLVARLYNSCSQAFNYPFIVKSIITVFGEYTFAASLILFVWLVNGVAYPLLIGIAPALKYIFFISDFITMYYFTVFARILGQLYYNNQKKLAWF